MTKNRKKSLLTAAFASTLLLAVGGVCVANVPASAETLTAPEIAVKQSASLRIDDFGMRFKTTVDTAYMADVTEVHTLIIPTAMLGGAELTSAVGNAIDQTLDIDKFYEVGNDRYYNSVLTEIPATEYGTEVTMRAYVVTTDGDEVYSEQSVSTSVAYLANASLELDYDAYANDLAKYLVKGIAMENTAGVYNAGNAVNVGATIEYFDEASAEVVEKLNAKYSLTYESDDNAVVSVVDGTITAVGRGTADITVTLTDGTTEFDTATYAVTVAQPKWGEVFDFEYINMNNVSVNYNESGTGIHASATESFGEDTNGKYIQATYNTGTTQNNDMHIRFFNSKAPVMSKAFDSVTVTYSAKYYKEDGSAGTVANVPVEIRGNANNKGTGTAGYKGANGNVYDYVRDKATCANFEAAMEVEPFRILFMDWNGTLSEILNVRIYGVQFSYNDIALDSDNPKADLTEKFGLTASEMKNVKFNGVEVADIANFTATANGTLTFTVEKEGFASTDMSVNVTYSELKDLDKPVFDFNNPDLTQISAGSSTAGATDAKSTITTGEDANGKYVEIVTLNTEYVNIRFFGAADAATLKKYDWVKVKFAGYYLNDGNKLNANIYTYIANASSTKNTKQVTIMGDDTLKTYEANRVTSSNFVDSIDDPLRVVFVNWGGYMTSDGSIRKTMVLRIYDIEFGYNDITSDGATAIDLTSKFGATADEITTATFTPTSTGTPAAIADKAAWTPTENGVLTVTVKKAGYKAVTYTLNVTVSTGA